MSLPDSGETHLHCAACGAVHYQAPASCVSTLLVSEGLVLLGRRGKSSIRPGKWCLPCGYMEGDENFVDAARREVREETGLEITPRSLVNVTTNHFPGGVHSLVVVVLAELEQAEKPQAGDDLVEVGWFPLEGPLPEMAFQADEHIIAQYRRFGGDFGIPLSDTEIEFTET